MFQKNLITSVGEKPTKRKIDLANELEIKILDQEDWLRMLNK